MAKISIRSAAEQRPSKPGARHVASARAVKGAKRRREPLTARFSPRPPWSTGTVGPHGSDRPQVNPGVMGMTVEDLVTVLKAMPQSYPVAAGSYPSADFSWVEDDVTVTENRVVCEVRLVGGEVVLA